MKRFLSVALFLFVFASPLHSQGVSGIDLRGLAAFRPGDDDTWRSKYIDEREGWNFIPVPGAWECNGYPLLDGFAWYRIRFTIPASMKDDSLLLVMSGVDDADETFLNGIGVGRTGAFPPDSRSELKSLRVYALPRFVREEYNLLAIRVYDIADSGGVTGGILRIIRADSIPAVLDEIVDEPYRPADYYFSNGIMASKLGAATLAVEWTNPRIYNELDEGLLTAHILSSLSLDVEVGGRTRALADLRRESFGYERQTGIVTGRFHEGLEVSWYHPHSSSVRALVVCARWRRSGDVGNVGIRLKMEQPYWKILERESDAGDERTKYFVLVFHSCCDELAERDAGVIESTILQGGRRAYEIEAEREWWRGQTALLFPLPEGLSPAEQAVYRQSVAMLAMSEVEEAGRGHGAFVAAFEPVTAARCVPRTHLATVRALALAGLTESAREGLDFIFGAETGAYALYDVYGTEHGIGFPYLVTPAWYLGAGKEKTWTRKDDATLAADGLPLFIEAVDAVLAAEKRRAVMAKRRISDSAMIAPLWKTLSAKAADVILYMQDSSGLIPRDDSPFGSGLETAPGICTSLHAAAALRIAAVYAELMRDGTRAFLYRQGAERTMSTIRALIAKVASRKDERGITPLEQRLFHPLLIDGITLGLFPPGSAEAQFAIDVIERGFSDDDAPGLYNAQPDGDWFERQARPLLALRLARAHAANRNRKRAEELFAFVTTLAHANNDLLPELIDPVSGNWHGGLPAIGNGAAEYILAVIELARMRTTAEKK